MSAAELREALDRIDGGGLIGWRYMTTVKAVADAARNIALPILEADSELVKRLMRIVMMVDATPKYRARRIAVLILEELAAISTPTPGAE